MATVGCVCLFLLSTVVSHVQPFFLARTLEKSEANHLIRMKRGSEEAYIDDDYVLVCCDELQNKVNNKLTSEDIKIMEECQEEVERKMGERDEMTPIKEYFLNYSTCGNQCLFQKHGWIDEEGNILKGVSAEIASIQMGITDASLLDSIATTCSAVARDYKENHNANYICNRTAMMFYTCSFDMVNLHCPTEHLICNDGCDRRMERVRNQYQSLLVRKGSLRFLTL
uniref:Chemosensory protein n=1 Tax=Blattella germanica TaxID=6973 RepID=A0A0X8DBR0_BLAGE|nr:chemosensory protein [Blattella germanica]